MCGGCEGPFFFFFFFWKARCVIRLPVDMAQRHFAWEFAQFSVGIGCQRRGAGPWVLQVVLEQS